MKDHHRMRAWHKHRKEFWDMTPGSVSAAALYRNNHNEELFIFEGCTGLRNKKGELVYEGDRFKADEKTAVVIFKNGTFGYYWGSNKTLFNKDIIWIVEECDPFGNIHQNPELLESK